MSQTSMIISTITIIGIGAFVLMASGAAVAHGASQLPRKERNVQWYLYALIGLWFSLAMIPAVSGTIDFLILGPFAALPIILGSALTFYGPIKNLIRHIPTHRLVFIQFYRVAGGIFLYHYYVDDLLTRGFAINAGYGDVITGLLAIPVGWMIWRKTRGHMLALILWSIFGIGDLIVAPASAFIYGGDGLENFPISIIPLFFGPPFGILIHTVTLRNFWLQRQS